jgi:hypothetical protein
MWRCGRRYEFDFKPFAAAQGAPIGGAAPQSFMLQPNGWAPNNQHHPALSPDTSRQRAYAHLPFPASDPVGGSGGEFTKLLSPA